MHTVEGVLSNISVFNYNSFTKHCMLLIYTQYEIRNFITYLHMSTQKIEVQV